MNCTSSVVSVVYMTGSKPADTPYRVRISAARSVRHGDSTALCDHITPWTLAAWGNTWDSAAREEMDAIDNALLTMGLGDREYKGPEEKAAPQPCRPRSLRHIPCRNKPIALVIHNGEGHLQGAYESCWTA